MSCKVIRDNNNQIVSVEVSSGVNSILFNELTNHYDGNKELALRKYAEIYTPSFKNQFNWEVDFTDKVNSQGEPQLRYLFNKPGLHLDPIHPSQERGTEFKKYLAYKENTINDLQKRLKNLKNEKRNAGSTQEYNEIVRKQKDIRERIYGKEGTDQLGLKGEVEQIKELTELYAIEPFATQDLQRLENLATSNDPGDIAEAKKIASFYINLGVFDPNHTHPIFEYEEIFNDDGSYKLPTEIRTLFQDWRNEAENQIRFVNNTERQLFVDSINNSRLTNKEKTFDELTRSKEGLKDASWVDMMIMDMSKGIFSHNGEIPQIMHQAIEDGIELKAGEQIFGERNLNQLLERINELSPLVEERLRQLGYSVDYKVFKGVDYDLFRQKDKNGLETGKLISRHSSQYESTLAGILNRFSERISDLRKPDVENKITKMRSQIINRNNKLKETSFVVDPSRIPEIRDAFPQYAQYYSADESNMDAYVAELKEHAGDSGYTQAVKEQIQLLKEYEREYDAEVTNSLDMYGVSSIDQLPAEVQADLEFQQKRNSPFIASQNFENNNLDSVIFSSDGGPIRRPVINYLQTNVKIPRRTNVQGNSTNYYDDRFAQVESDPILSEMHSIAEEVFDVIYNTVPEDYRDKIDPSSIPSLDRSLAEIMLDPEATALEKLSTAYQKLKKNIHNLIRVRPQNNELKGTLDVTTGQPDVEVNTNFVKNNSREINLNFQILKVNFLEDFNRNLGEFDGRLEDLDRNSKVAYTFINQDLINMFSEMYQIPPTIQAVRNLGDPNSHEVPVGELLYNYAVSEAVRTKSFDLPKLLKLYANSTVEYAAKNEVLPQIMIMRDYYRQIETPAANNVGESITSSVLGRTVKKGLRVNANRQLDSQLQRVLGVDFNQDSEKKHNVTGKKILTKEEQEEVEQINETIDKLPEDDTLRDFLIRERDSIGGNLSISKAFESLLNFQRWRILGYNLDSGITNRLEGLSANFIAAASGRYFDPNNIYRAMNIVHGSVLKTLSLGKIETNGAAKLRAIMDRFDVLQDASNELQKASYKSAISGIKKFQPYELTRRVEYATQGEMVVAKMLSTSVTGENGQQSNAWDILDRDGKVKEGFRTEENVATWEQASGQGFVDWKTSVAAMIEHTHGNYHNLRGMKAKETTLGRALMMFKTWMSNQFYLRFAVEQDDLQIGSEGYKGMYKSHTPASAAIQGGIAGSLLFGPAGGLAGAGLGIGLSYMNNVQKDIGHLQELGFLAKSLARKAIGIPINLATSPLRLKSNGQPIFSNLSVIEDLQDRGFSEVDAQNLNAVMTEIAFLLNWVALRIMAKLFFEDDEEKNSKQHKLYNYLSNKTAQLASQALTYVYPVENWKSTLTPAVFTFISELGKLGINLTDAMNGTDTITRGPYAGQSKTARSLRKTFVPMTGIFGTDKFDQEFTHSKAPYDKLFWSKEKRDKKQLEGKRARRRATLNLQYEEYKKQLIQDGFSEEDAERKVKKLIRNIMTKEGLY